MEAALGECLSLPPRLPHMPAVSAAAAAALPRVDLWALDNSMATFLAATPADSCLGRCYDLRTPVGPTPAALLACGAAELVTDAAAEAATLSAARRGSVASLAGRDSPQELAPMQAGVRLLLTSDKLYERFHATRSQQRSEEVSRIITPSGACGGRGVDRAARGGPRGDATCMAAQTPTSPPPLPHPHCPTPHCTTQSWTLCACGPGMGSTRCGGRA